MKIVKNSIKDCSPSFEILENLMQGCNYNIYFNVKKFTFEEDYLFSINEMQSLYPDEEIDGQLIKHSFKNAKKNINDYLKFGVNDVSIYSKKIKEWQNLPDSMYQYYKYVFWKMNYEKLLNSSIQYVYQYEPDSDFLGMGVFWDFTYIFLTEYEGVIIYAASYD